MNQLPRYDNVTIEDLMALVEKAAGAIERLQAANQKLAAQLRERTNAALDAAAELEKTAMQIEELERAAALLREDAHWCRWFRNRYGGADFASFYTHIESEYRREHPEGAEKPDHIELPQSGGNGLRPH